MRYAAALLIPAGLALIVGPLSAQRPALRGISGGGLATLATSSAAQLPGKKSSFGWLAGISLGWKAGPQVLIGPELEYVQKGVRQSSTTERDRWSFGYVELPVLLRVALSQAAGVRPFITGGAEVAYQASCKVHATDASGSASHACDDPLVGAQVRKSDYGLIVGAGVESGRVGLSLRFDMGFNNINQNGSDTARNRTLLLLASFRFTAPAEGP